MARVGQNHTYMVYTQYFRQEYHQIHSVYIHMVLANPINGT